MGAHHLSTVEIGSNIFHLDILCGRFQVDFHFECCLTKWNDKFCNALEMNWSDEEKFDIE